MRKLEVLQGSKRADAKDNRIVVAPAPELVSRVHKLLDALAVDVRLIATEMRRDSGLEALVLRLAASLSLLQETSAQKLEQAISAMGPDRLRVVLNTWILLQERARETAACDEIAQSQPEAVYLATLVRYLGLDSRGTTVLPDELFSFALTPDHMDFSDLREMLMRDFLALIPVLDPALLRSTRTATPE